MKQLPPGLQPFADYHQFIIWQKIPLANGKTDKVPVDVITHLPHDPHDPTIWMSADNAILIAEMMGEPYGVGFVFTPDDPFFFIDIDHQIDTPIVKELLTKFKGCAVEISQSNNGYHIFGTGDCPLHGCDNKEFYMQFYTENRFAALTGNMVDDGVASTSTTLLPWLVNTFFPTVLSGGPGLTDWTTEPVSEWNGPTDDEVLINKALSSGGAKVIFGGSSPFKDLWTGDTEALSDRYPDPDTTKGWGYSEADAGLAQHLAFWTGKDCERIERLMRQSALMREKWDRRERSPGYLQTTILKACGLCSDVYGASTTNSSLLGNHTDNNEVEAPPVSGKDGLQYMTPQNQVEHFKGCIYVLNSHRIWIPDGSFLKPDQFKVWYGGYLFALDSINSKETKSAYEAFTESQAIKFPKVNATCFRPEIPSGTIVNEEGRTMVNTYVPIETESKKGDPSRYLDFMTKLLPNERDREILISFMAAAIQYPGVKFQWAPLIQGTQGNGKTIIMHILTHAIGRRYTHLPNAADLAGNGLKFTGWMVDKRFIGIEEIYVSERREITEALKPFITNPYIEIQAKGVDQYTGENRAIFIFCTNHKDALSITLDGRRYCVFYTAQQTKDDLTRDGMTEEYFYKFYNWLREEGYAIINDYLQNYQIQDEFNPATLCQRAPLTSSTQEAVTLSLGAVEQEVQEAIDEGRPGFAGGWVSSKMLDKLLENIHASRRITVTKRRALLQNLGYDWHPALMNTNGRINNPIMIEGGKPKLFAKIGHPNNNLQTVPMVVKSYMEAQGYVTTVVDAKVNKG